MELEGLYRDIVEGSTDGFWLLDLEGNTLYANPALLGMFGYTAEQIQPAERLRPPRRDRPQPVRPAPRRRPPRGAARPGRRVHVPPRRRHAAVGAGQREPAALPRRRAGRAPAPGQRLQRPAPDPRGAHREPAAARRGPADRPDRLLGVGPATRRGHRLRRAAPALRHRPRLLPRDLRAGAGERARGRPGGLRGRRTPGARRRRRVRVRGADRGRARLDLDARPRASCTATPTGEAVVVTGTHQDITEAKQAEIALEDQVRQNTLMQAIASAANEAHTLEDVLVQARSLVLLHDDWERARAFVLADGRVGSGAALRPARGPRPTTRRRPRPRPWSWTSRTAPTAPTRRSGTSSS